MSLGCSGPEALRQLKILNIPLLALSVVLLGTAPLPAEDSRQDALRDLHHSILARKLLLDDPLLGPLNLGVKVRNRLAILWGPVPSIELAHRAVTRLQEMPELVGVRNHMFVEAEDLPAIPPSSQPAFLPDPQPSPENGSSPGPPLPIPGRPDDSTTPRIAPAVVLASPFVLPALGGPERGR